MSQSVVIHSGAMGAVVIFKHRGNILRLVKGTESKFTFKWGNKTLLANKDASVTEVNDAAGSDREETK